MTSLRDSEKELAQFDVAYFMVSLDDPDKNREFAESLGAKFVLLSDPEKKTADAYGVLAVGGLYARRWTFYIDRAGVVRYIDRDVDTSSHGQDVVRRLGELGFPRR
jgi:peroxiredoxin Q/BCP